MRRQTNERRPRVTRDLGRELLLIRVTDSPPGDVCQHEHPDRLARRDHSRRHDMDRQHIKIAVAAIVAGTALTAGLVTATTAGAHGRVARATLATADGTRIGSVEFNTNRGHTNVTVRLRQAPGLDAFHGFHIHANDVPTNGDGCIADPAALSNTWFVSADGHYNPSAQTHAHHAGDMPVVYVNADGSVETRFQIDAIEPGELNGKVVILHAGPDNYANIPLGAEPTQYTANSPDATTGTSKTGNAGDRIACGEIRTR
jgi:superoxide dismutase, Cu-Zn family